jgi:serine/threonine-protein kinase RsbW
MTPDAHAAEEGPPLVLRHLNELPALSPWVQKVAERATLPPRTSLEMELAIEEAVVNVLTHSEGAREVVLSVGRHHDGTVAVQIVDDGAPFDPTVWPPPPKPTSLATAPIGGLGVHLMRHLAKSMRYDRCDDRNRLILTFERPRA